MKMSLHSLHTSQIHSHKHSKYANSPTCRHLGVKYSYTPILGSCKFNSPCCLEKTYIQPMNKFYETRLILNHGTKNIKRTNKWPLQALICANQCLVYMMHCLALTHIKQIPLRMSYMYHSV